MTGYVFPFSRPGGSGSDVCLALSPGPRGLTDHGRRCPTRLRLELDPLRQRQLRRPVDGVGLPPHVSLPRVAAGFAPAARVLLAAEGAADLRSAGADVDVGDPAVAAPVAQEGFRRQ